MSIFELEVAPGRLAVTAALRLPQAPLRQQFTRIAPHLVGVDLLVFDQSGIGDAAAELLPKTPPHVGVCLIGGDRPLARSAQGDRLVVGKSWLIQRLGAAMRSGKMTVAECAPGRDLLRNELAQFIFKPGARGRLRLEAARGHDDWSSRPRSVCSQRTSRSWSKVKASGRPLYPDSRGAVSRCPETPRPAKLPLVNRRKRLQGRRADRNQNKILGEGRQGCRRSSCGDATRLRIAEVVEQDVQLKDGKVELYRAKLGCPSSTKPQTSRTPPTVLT